MFLFMIPIHIYIYVSVAYGMSSAPAMVFFLRKTGRVVVASGLSTVSIHNPILPRTVARRGSFSSTKNDLYMRLLLLV